MSKMKILGIFEAENIKKTRVYTILWYTLYKSRALNFVLDSWIESDIYCLSEWNVLQELYEYLRGV